MKNATGIGRVLVIGDASSVHLFRWAGYLRDVGIDTLVASVQKKAGAALDFGDICPIRLREAPLSEPKLKGKLRNYLFYLRQVISRDVSVLNFHFLHWNLVFFTTWLWKPFVLTCWGSDVLVSYAQSAGLKKLLYDIVLRKAKIITFDSDSVKELLMARCVGIRGEALQQIFWGVDTNIFRPASVGERESARRQLKLPADAIVISSVRGVSEFYRIHEIIEWFLRQLSNNANEANIYLLIRVPASSDPRYVERCQQIAGSCDFIVFDFQTSSAIDMPGIYWASDTTLHFPVSDATPVSMLEAFACKCSVVCRDSIAAYNCLSSTYELMLTDLDVLTFQLLIEYLERRQVCAAHNFRHVNTMASRDATLQLLRSVFVRLRRNYQ